MACHYRLWEAQMVGRHRALHTIIAFGLHTQLNDVGRGMPSSPIGSTHGRTTLGMACHYCHWNTYMIILRWSKHSIISLGQHTLLDVLGCGMPSLPLDGKHGRTM